MCGWRKRMLPEWTQEIDRRGPAVQTEQRLRTLIPGAHPTEDDL